MQKRLLIPSRVRRVPQQFSWVDQRLVRNHYLSRCDVRAWALYLFLVSVADAQGLSYYADDSISRLLSLDREELIRARQALIVADLVAYEAPLYQLLALAPCATPKPYRDVVVPREAGSQKRSRGAVATTGLRSIREVLRQAMEERP